MQGNVWRMICPKCGKNDCCVATIIENEEEFKGTDIESAPFFTSFD